jgi:DNA (cytosine-5)-methyltransferase 1
LRVSRIIFNKFLVFEDFSLINNELLFVDLFAGCGGLSLGLLNAGWKGSFAVERSPDAFNTLKHNLINNGSSSNPNSNIIKFSNWPKWLKIHEWDISELLEKHSEELKQLKGNICLLAGGPPCQGFSMAGKRSPTDKRNQLFNKYINYVDLIDPSVILVENVSGMNMPFPESKHGKTYAAQLKEALQANYFVEQDIVQSSKFGVPQIRPRFITVGFNKRINFQGDFFEQLNKNRIDFLTSKGLPIDRPVTVDEAIGDIRRCGRTRLCKDPFSPKGKFREIVYDESKMRSSYQRLQREGCEEKYQPDSLRLINHLQSTVARFEMIRKFSRKGVTVGKAERKKIESELNIKIKKQAFTFLDGNKPAHTITTLPDDLIHYQEPRVHTVREYARFQSFPDWFEFKGKFTTGGKVRKIETPRYTQVGNAVPPLLAEALGRTLKQIILGAR